MKFGRIASRLVRTAVAVEDVRSLETALNEAIRSTRINSIDVNKWIGDHFWLEDLFKGSHDDGARKEVDRIRQEIENLFSEAKLSYSGMEAGKSWSQESSRLFASRVNSVINSVKELVRKSLSPQRGPAAVKELIKKIFTTPIDEIERYGIIRFIDRFWWPSHGADVAEAVIRSRRAVKKQVKFTQEMLKNSGNEILKSNVLDEEGRIRLVEDMQALSEDLNTIDADAFYLEHSSFIVDDIIKSIVPAITNLIDRTTELGSFKLHPKIRYFQAHMMDVESSVDSIRRHYTNLINDAKKMVKIIESDESMNIPHSSYASMRK